MLRAWIPEGPTPSSGGTSTIFPWGSPGAGRGAHPSKALHSPRSPSRPGAFLEIPQPRPGRGSLDRQGIDAAELVRDAGLGLESADRSTGTASASGTAAVAGSGLAALLRAMASKGSILMRATDETFALLPFVVGMYEMQIARLSRELVQDTTEFMHQGFGLELPTTGEPQTRVIPIGAAIRPEHRIADYDECRSLIRAAGIGSRSWTASAAGLPTWRAGLAGIRTGASSAWYSGTSRTRWSARDGAGR
ncbi:MAG: hypothetical protein MZV70_06085 [Desulfobacterales bacterium]|nr:hypothetical protein [Desulfobacterales bacterium]